MIAVAGTFLVTLIPLVNAAVVTCCVWFLSGALVELLPFWFGADDLIVWFGAFGDEWTNV